MGYIVIKPINTLEDGVVVFSVASVCVCVSVMNL